MPTVVGELKRQLEEALIKLERERINNEFVTEVPISISLLQEILSELAEIEDMQIIKLEISDYLEEIEEKIKRMSKAIKHL